MKRMDKEQVECRGSDDGFEDDLAGAEIQFFSSPAVQCNLRHGADRQAQGAGNRTQSSFVLGSLGVSFRKVVMPKNARAPIGRLM